MYFSTVQARVLVVRHSTSLSNSLIGAVMPMDFSTVQAQVPDVCYSTIHQFGWCKYTYGLQDCAK